MEGEQRTNSLSLVAGLPSNLLFALRLRSPTGKRLFACRLLSFRDYLVQVARFDSWLVAAKRALFKICSREKPEIEFHPELLGTMYHIAGDDEPRRRLAQARKDDAVRLNASPQDCVVPPNFSVQKLSIESANAPLIKVPTAPFAKNERNSARIEL